MRKITALFLVVVAILGLLAPLAEGAELKPETLAAFDRYIRVTEARMKDDLREDHFFFVDRLPENRRHTIDEQLLQGKVEIQRLESLEEGRTIPIPSGMIHHWAGVIFVPNATLPQVRSILEDYDELEKYFKPDIRQSKLLERNGNASKAYLQLYKKSMVTVLLNANFDNTDTQVSNTRAQTRSYSSRIAEVVNQGKPDEHELPVGIDHGYMWRLYIYWRMEEKRGGVYLQIEVVALTRKFPLMLGWLINPLIENIPRSTISGLLINTRRAVVKRSTPTPRSLAPATLLGSQTAVSGARTLKPSILTLGSLP
jgi:hypothetical protein